MPKRRRSAIAGSAFDRTTARLRRVVRPSPDGRGTIASSATGCAAPLGARGSRPKGSMALIATAFTELGTQRVWAQTMTVNTRVAPGDGALRAAVRPHVLRRLGPTRSKAPSSATSSTSSPSTTGSDRSSVDDDVAARGRDRDGIDARARVRRGSPVGRLRLRSSVSTGRGRGSTPAPTTARTAQSGGRRGSHPETGSGRPIA